MTFLARDPSSSCRQINTTIESNLGLILFSPENLQNNIDGCLNEGTLATERKSCNVHEAVDERYERRRKAIQKLDVKNKISPSIVESGFNGLGEKAFLRKSDDSPSIASYSIAFP